jgi:hypothetical protein
VPSAARAIGKGLFDKRVRLGEKEVIQEIKKVKIKGKTLEGIYPASPFYA